MSWITWGGMSRGVVNSIAGSIGLAAPEDISRAPGSSAHAAAFRVLQVVIWLAASSWPVMAPLVRVIAFHALPWSARWRQTWVVPVSLPPKFAGAAPRHPSGHGAGIPEPS